MNSVNLVGRVTKDVELRQAGTHTTCSFILAVDTGRKDENNNKIADFITCCAWDGTANYITSYIKKGYLMAVSGKIQTRSYQAQNGETKYITEVLANSVENLTPRNDNNQAPKPSAPAPKQNNVDDSDLPF